MNSDEDASLYRPHLLVVEDEGIIARDIEVTLQGLGYTVCDLASDAEEALAKAERHRPDLVLMDIRLRGATDGVEAARAIRERMGIPVVFLTAHADRATLDRAADAEPYGYVLKPFEERELQVTITMALCKHRAFAELDRRVRERTEELFRSEDRYQRLSSVSELGLFALETPDLPAVMDRAVATVAKIVGCEFVKLLELRPDGDELVLRAGLGWSPGAVGSATVPTGRRSMAGLTLLTGQPVVSVDVASDPRFSLSPLMEQHQIVSGAAVVVHGPEGKPYGVLGADSRTRRELSEIDVMFMQAAANVVGAAVIRARAEQSARAAEARAREERVRLEQARAAVRERDEFIAVASHELRTPLTGLYLKLERLEQQSRRAKTPGGKPGPIRTDAVEGAMRQATRLATLVESMLDASRIAAGRMHITREDVDLGALAQHVVQDFHDEAERAGSRIGLRVIGTPCGLWDRQRLQQVLVNLISNAIKYGPGQPIDVTVEESDGRARISVADRGVGIAPEDVSRIFDRFQRAVSARQYGGLGLGLYIARQIVELHGGSIAVSTVPGHGSTFVVDLPLGRHHEAEVAGHEPAPPP